MSFNAEAFVEQQVQFDWYDGGGLDLAFLGAAEVDNKATSTSASSRDVAWLRRIYQHHSECEEGGLLRRVDRGRAESYRRKDGKLEILQEGKGKKFVKKVEQVTFSGKYANKTKQPVLYITERAVFELQNGEVTLTEMRPGVDLQKDVLAQMEFAPKVSPNLKLMPSEIFQADLGKAPASTLNPRKAELVKRPNGSLQPTKG